MVTADGQSREASSFWADPPGRPNRQNRQRLANEAAIRLMAMAVELDADLAVEEVSGLKKRGRNPKANVAA
ncbi:MAG: hypothetical protein HYT48_02290, partial [Candidatus Vogelbacteria bacterium]|nr:hypothetical protein [Candidatus Vogelbacteria bacterium]